MGQSEVFELLRDRRILGDDKFYSQSEIYKLMISLERPVSRSNLFKDLRKLSMFGYLDVRFGRRRNHYNKIYRVKDFYV